MLKKFENWLLQNNYKPNTAKDYKYRISTFNKNYKKFDFVPFGELK